MTMRARFSSPRYQYTYIHRHHPQGRCGTEGAGRAEEKVTAVRRRGPDSHPKARAGHRYIPRCLCARGTSTVEMHRIRISPRCFFLLNIYYIINSLSIKISLYSCSTTRYVRTHRNIFLCCMQRFDIFHSAAFLSLPCRVIQNDFQVSCF